MSDASGLAAVKLRLTRRSGGRCSYFSGRRQALERTRCGRAFFFKVGDSPDCLLPAARAARARPLRARHRGGRPRRQPLGPRARQHAGGVHGPMRRALAIVLVTAAGAAAGAAPAGAATVQAMVVGKDKVLRAPRAVTLRSRTVKVGSKRCAVARATPLAALRGTGLRVRLRDYGSCGRRARDSGQPLRLAGSARTAIAAATAGSTRSGARPARRARPTRPARSGPAGCARATSVTWFWCVLATSGCCQRTLEVVPASGSATAGSARARHRARLRRQGPRGQGVGGATVALGTADRHDRRRTARRRSRCRRRAVASGSPPATPAWSPRSRARSRCREEAAPSPACSPSCSSGCGVGAGDEVSEQRRRPGDARLRRARRSGTRGSAGRRRTRR